MNLPWKFRIATLLCAVSVACTSPVQTADDYIRWIKDPDHGLVLSRATNGVILSLQYLPTDYLVYNEAKNLTMSQNQLDSIRLSYENSLTFLLTLSPDTKVGASGDVMLRGLANKDEFSERAVQMNFQMEKYFSLHANDGEFKPVLAAMENTYGLSEHRKIIIVFEDPGRDSPVLDIVYSDELFGLGINHFTFDKQRIEEVPRFSPRTGFR